MKKITIAAFCATASLLAAAAAFAQRPADLAPTEKVWVAAPTPKGGVSWKVLESTREIQRTENGVIFSKPDFPAAVKELAGKKIKVNGYIMPLQTSAMQSHFVLLAYPPDCPFHLSPAPTQFMEIRVSSPVDVTNEGEVRTIEGTLVLGGADESGIFYQIVEGREI